MSQRKALIVVDVQPTFCEGGELGVEGGNDCAAAIAEFFAAHGDEYDYVATTQDWHIKPGAHFSQTPDFVDSWPPHGVAGTPNAELHPLIKALGIAHHFKKGEYAAAYSGFEGHDEKNEDVSLDEALVAEGIDALDVVGIAESHCVKQTALDGVANGYDVRVFTDLTVPVSEELGELARREMARAGVELVESSQV
ncbi:MAG: isochorismatase family protein [Bifidobacteriaceae bacterium]|jgi:nicotinamidase/pyrazinamidase|nr:isochorismatase family protein [Bifidobacteriaceae bacterium]MCI1978724.1 isochorismatase family protein [Bifidobacteriaceae bacterium]